MGNFMCGHNEASGGFSFFEGLTYNYIKKSNQQPQGYISSKVYKTKRSICSRMGRNTRDNKEQGESNKDTLLSQFSWNKMKERSHSFTETGRDQNGYKKAIPFSELCLNANQEIQGSQCKQCQRIQKHKIRIIKNQDKLLNQSLDIHQMIRFKSFKIQSTLSQDLMPISLLGQRLKIINNKSQQDLINSYQEKDYENLLQEVQYTQECQDRDPTLDLTFKPLNQSTHSSDQKSLKIDAVSFMDKIGASLLQTPKRPTMTFACDECESETSKPVQRARSNSLCLICTDQHKPLNLIEKQQMMFKGLLGLQKSPRKGTEFSCHQQQQDNIHYVEFTNDLHIINQKLVNFDKYESAASADFNDDLDSYEEELLMDNSDNQMIQTQKQQLQSQVIQQEIEQQKLGGNNGGGGILGDFSLLLEFYFNDDTQPGLEGCGTGLIADLDQIQPTLTDCKVEDFGMETVKDMN